MKKPLLVAVLSVLALAPTMPVAAETAASPSPHAASHDGLKISVHRAEQPGVYQVLAEIADSANGETSAATGLFVRPGEWASHSIPVRNGRPAFELSATVDPTGRLAAYMGREMADGDPRRAYSGTLMVTP